MRPKYKERPNFEKLIIIGEGGSAGAFLQPWSAAREPYQIVPWELARHRWEPACPIQIPKEQKALEFQTSQFRLAQQRCRHFKLSTFSLTYKCVWGEKALIIYIFTFYDSKKGSKTGKATMRMNTEYAK